MDRRTFLRCTAGGLGTWSLEAGAQSAAMATVGFLCSESAPRWARLVGAFRQGLGETGLVDGQNVAIEFRWAGGNDERLPALAAELVRRQVTVLVATGGATPALAAKAATSTI